MDRGEGGSAPDGAPAAPSPPLPPLQLGERYSLRLDQLSTLTIM